MAGQHSDSGVTQPAPATGLALTDRLRTSTRKVHDTSDRLVNLKLAYVLTSPKLYGEAISLFEPIYTFLEEALDRNVEHPVLGELHRFLGRTEGFKSDIEFFLGDVHTSPAVPAAAVDGAQTLPRPAALEQYLAHLSELEQTDPALLLAYYFHMYMAIFAGGYLIKKMVGRAFGLDSASGDGVQTFVLADGVNPGTFRKEYKEAINAIALSPGQIDAVIKESAEVFSQNNALVATVNNTAAYRVAVAEFWDWATRRVAVGAAVAIAAAGLWFKASPG